MNLLDYSFLTDGEIDLVIEEKLHTGKENSNMPIYIYKITLHDMYKKIGSICLRAGFDDNIYFGGHIGYEIKKEYRGNYYAAKACEIIKQVAIAHGLNAITITCNPDNIPSRKTCEKVGAKLIEVVDIPPDNDMYKEGDRRKCRYGLIINDMIS